VPLLQRDEEIKTFPSNRAHEPFTKRIRLRRPKRSPQDDDTQRLQGAIQFRRVDAVPVVENEPVGLLTRDDLSKLLDRPSCGRVIGHVAVSNLACSYLHLHYYKHVENSKASGHDDKEIAG
jgi:hypothetical protein